MSKLIKNKKMKIDKKISFFLSILVFYIIFSIFMIELILGENNVSYTRPLKNGYYIEYIAKKETKLKNDRVNYEYSENFPSKSIVKYLSNDDLFILLDDIGEYYIIIFKTDLVLGPLNQAQFVETLEDMEYYDFLDWNWNDLLGDSTIK